MLKPTVRPEPTAACLQLDTRSQLDQSSAVAVLDPQATRGGLSFESLRCRVERQLDGSATLRQVLEPGLADPTWRLTGHVHPIVPPGAVSERALCALVGELSSRPLEPSRPAWNLYVIEGLCGGLVAVVLVMHSALADPRTCTELLCLLLGMTPGSRPGRDRTGGQIGVDPGGLAARTDSEQRASRDLAGPGPLLESDDLGCGAATQRWGHALSNARGAAYARSHRAAIDVVRRAFCGTREDVALAACTRALRRYLQAHGDRVDRPLVAALPWIPRADDRERTLARFVRLPVPVSDPVDQLRFIVAETNRGVTRLQTDLRCDLVFGYQSGHARSLYVDGNPVIALHPHGPLLEGAGLDIRVIRYGDSIDFGLMVCPDLVPDAVEIATGIDDAVADLVKRSFEAREGSLELSWRPAR